VVSPGRLTADQRLRSRLRHPEHHRAPTPQRVQIVLKNVGSIAYDDFPGNGAKLVDAEDQQYDATLNDLALGPSIPSQHETPPTRRNGPTY
jgi:hypothetical protein